MNPIGQLLHLAALHEQALLHQAIARNIGGGEAEDGARVVPAGPGAGGASEAPPPAARPGQPGASPLLPPHSLAGLAPPASGARTVADEALALVALTLGGLQSQPSARAGEPARSLSGAGSWAGAADREGDAGLPAREPGAALMSAPPGSLGRALAIGVLARLAAAEADSGRDASTRAHMAESPGSAERSLAGQAEMAPVGPGARAAASESAMRAGGPSSAEAEAQRTAEAGARPPGLPEAPVLQVERAGVIASFILNAAMLPGWPERRFLPAGPAFGSGPQAMPEMTEQEINAYLASLGLPALAERSGALSAQAQRRRRMLVFLAVLATQVALAVETLRQELATLLAAAAEDSEAEMESLRARMSL